MKPWWQSGISRWATALILFAAPGAINTAQGEPPKTRPSKPFSIFDFGQDDPRVGPDEVPRPLPPLARKAPETQPSVTPTPPATPLPTPLPPPSLPNHPAAVTIAGPLSVAVLVQKAIEVVDTVPGPRTMDTRPHDLMQIIKFQLRVRDVAGARATYQLRARGWSRGLGISGVVGLTIKDRPHLRVCIDRGFRQQWF
jgi:hypothetical protein